MIPDAVREHLEATGAWNADRIGRAVTARVCRRCGAHVLAGLDDERAAWAVEVDAEPLTTLGECLAVLAGRSTYALRGRSARRLELDYRDRSAIAFAPPGSGPFDVVALHRCDALAMPPGATTGSRLRRTTRADATGDPPFRVWHDPTRRKEPLQRLEPLRGVADLMRRPTPVSVLARFLARGRLVVNRERLAHA